MENRFGIKDLFLFLLIGGLIVVVVMAMNMFDRQYKEVLAIKRQNNELTRDVVQIKRQLAEGVTAIGIVPGGATGATTRAANSAVQGPNAFTYIREAEKRPDFARGDWFIDNFGTKIGRLTPHVSTDIYQRWVEFQVMEGLAVRDPFTVDYVPRLATHWDISPDGLTMRFYLRRNVEFSDGEPLTADDVVFTFKWIMNPAVQADRTRAYLTKLKDVKKIDDYTIEFTFTEFYYLNFGTVAEQVTVMPEHFYSKFTPEQFNERTGLLMGSGPYKLEDPANWTPGQRVQIVRNERYWGVPATFDRIVFNELQGESTEMVVYGNQQHDIIRCTPPQYEKLKNDPRIMAFSNSYEYDYMYGGYLYCAWNQVRKEGGKDVPTRFADRRVRQAMTMLLDRERMSKEIFLGYASPASGPFAPGGPQANPAVRPWSHDESRAKALLAEAGYRDRDGDGVIDGPDGQPFRFTLTYPATSEVWEQVVLFMKDSYARAGILMEPDKVEWPVLVDKLNTTNFEAVTLGWSREPESDPYQVFHSSQIAGQGDNRVSYRSEEVDRLIEKARTTVDKDARMKVWHEVHRVLHEDQPYTFLFERKALRLFNKRIQNIKPSTVGLNFEYLVGGMIPWYVPSGQQKYTQ